MAADQHRQKCVFTGCRRGCGHGDNPCMELTSAWHSAVDWDRQTPDHRVPVKCPECAEPRLLGAKEVRYRLRIMKFSPYCAKHRAGRLGRRPGERPNHPAVDWSRVRLVDDTSEPWRKRRLVPVASPGCRRERWLKATYVARRIRQNAFDAACPRHR